MTVAYDQHNVDSFLAGYLVPLTPPERREVIHQLTNRGWSAAEISDRVGISQRHVVRDRGLWTPQPIDETTPRPPRPYPQDSFDDREMRAAAARFIGAVHDLENGWELTATMPPDDVRALLVICAAACDPDKNINQMLAWIDRLTQQPIAS